MSNPDDIRAIPNRLHPILTYVYGLFKAHANAHETAVLHQFAGAQLPPMEQAAVDLLPTRVAEAFMSYKSISPEFINWIFHDREFTNYTYDLNASSRAYLTSFVSVTAGIEYGVAEGYIKELEDDIDLKRHILEISASEIPSQASRQVFYGRRLGWYALARAKKPKIIVETGLDKGMGSCVLSSALLRNTMEGHPGRYFGIDNQTSAGKFFRGRYAEVGELLFGDSATVLSTFNHTIDLLIADSSHAEGYEGKEYSAIQQKLSSNALVISDADYEALAQFAIQTGRRFLYWPEWPKNHFYPGAGIALAYR